MEQNIPIKNKSVQSFFCLENSAFIGIMLIVFFTPIFFIPSLFFTLPFSKTILVFSVLVISFCLVIISILKHGRFNLPWGKTYFFTALVPVVLLVSAIVSQAPFLSLIGNSFEIDTFAFLLFMFLLMFLTGAFFQKEQRIFYSYILFFASTVILTLFVLVRFIFGSSALSFGLFTSIDANPLGKLYDLGILYGAVLLLSIISIEMFSLNKVFKRILYALFAVALVFLVIINFSLNWVVLAVVSVLFFFYNFYAGKIINKKVRNISVVALCVMFVSIAFILPLGKNLSESFSNKLNISIMEVRPSWSTTFDISKEVLEKNPLFGIGLNRFSSQWQLSKPEGINTTPFWNTHFTNTIGFIPTFLTTSGALGFLAWIVFLAFFLRAGFVSLFQKTENSLLKYLTVSSFFVSLYLWTMSFVYVPGNVVIVLTFFFTGLFFASLHKEKFLKSKEIVFSHHPRTSFAMILVLILAMFSSLAFGYTALEKFVSAYYFNKAVVGFSQNSDIVTAENYMLQAIALDKNDLYFRGFASLGIVHLNKIVASVTSDQVSEAVKNEFQTVLRNAIASAGQAIDIDNTNYRNWETLAKVYQEIAPLGVDKAFENSVSAYEEALKRSPSNPEIYLSLARLSTPQKDFVKAKEYISRALSQKPNYSEALFLRSQIEVTEGNVAGAIVSMENISVISPGDAGVFFELGLLKYNNKNFAGAVDTFSKAVNIIPQYSNAKYFLGLSLDEIGKKAEAIQQFKDIAVLNPDNAEVALILGNLNAGRDAFTNAKPPVDGKPEKRSKLPIDDTENQ
ncbi:tetratricopeptide repeat protein [Candidatus Parcubacteria bacterium]|nr:tetratricopeptide repeat protein [Candidatus Parcubacteria bacterium]